MTGSLVLRNKTIDLADCGGDVSFVPRLKTHRQKTFERTYRRDIREKNLVWTARYDGVVLSLLNKDHRLITVRFESAAKRVVTLLHALHRSEDRRSRVKASDCNIFLRTKTVHSGMLQNGVLLKTLGIAAVEEPNQIGNRNSTIKNLAADENVHWRTQAKLSGAIEHRHDLLV